MSERYFVESPITSDRAVLAGPEAHHAIHVMRLSAGAEVTLFDGSGSEFSARVEQIRHAQVELAVLSRAQIDRELPAALTLGVALPKGDRQRWLVEKAVELGVASLVPLETARSVARPTEQALARLRRTVIEASKQCGRNRLMEIAPPQTWAEFLAAPSGDSFRLFAHPCAGLPSTFGRGVGGEGGPAVEEAGCASLPSPDQPSVGARRGAGGEGLSGGARGDHRVFLAIGPEGGFTDEEVSAALSAAWRQVDLGPRILRIETAALALVAQIAVYP
jgi:16S rRNA (uracil1498-N3)-methyltransferase